MKAYEINSRREVTELECGDVAGHEFHGNQYTNEAADAKIGEHDEARFNFDKFTAHTASMTAWKRTKEANEKDTAEAHRAAYAAHYHAKLMHETAGGRLDPTAKAHGEAAQHHNVVAREKGEEKPEPKPSAPERNPHPAGSREHNRWESYHRGSDD